MFERSRASMYVGVSVRSCYSFIMLAGLLGYIVPGGVVKARLALFLKTLPIHPPPIARDFTFLAVARARGASTAGERGPPSGIDQVANSRERSSVIVYRELGEPVAPCSV